MNAIEPAIISPAVSTALLCIEMDQPDRTNERQALIESLVQQPATIAFKYFYDSLGSALFEAITQLDEYYPTRTEMAIMDQNIAAIGQAIGGQCTLIDLGAGSCRKAAQLLPVLNPSQYVAVDVSTHYLSQSLQQMQRQFEWCSMLGVSTDFSKQLNLPLQVQPQKRVFFYPGSSLGNFSPEQAIMFLQRVRQQCSSDGALLLGLDLVKEHGLLNAAYDDALGVTAAFNLNALNNVNRELGSNFRTQDFSHRGFFNPDLSRVEMHLEARRDVQISWLDSDHSNRVRTFKQGDRIHTESSYKYTLEQLSPLLGSSGFEIEYCWTDAAQHFAVVLARPV